VAFRKDKRDERMIVIDSARYRKSKLGSTEPSMDSRLDYRTSDFGVEYQLLPDWSKAYVTLVPQFTSPKPKAQPHASQPPARSAVCLQIT
jgi:hypothetical protein